VVFCGNFSNMCVTFSNWRMSLAMEACKALFL
jgi:hypothetical protein